MDELTTVVYLGRINDATSRVFEYFMSRGMQIIYTDLTFSTRSYWRDAGSLLFVDVNGIGGNQQVDSLLDTLKCDGPPVPTILFYSDQLTPQGKLGHFPGGVAPLFGFDDPYSIEFSIAQATSSCIARKMDSEITLPNSTNPAPVTVFQSS
ncbi:hypothetical protein AAFO90_24210 [Phaeobacter sp. CAU 1743]|uniref:hypothetical protein n=1 Tax=Phaeobacter sp. CAU 1743 TaxID=3140367 RepID=UPI00325BE418